MSLSYAKDDWYVVGDINQLRSGQSRQTKLLGQDITVSGTVEAPHVQTADGTSLPVMMRYDHLWTSPGANTRPTRRSEARFSRRCIPRLVVHHVGSKRSGRTLGMPPRTDPIELFVFYGVVHATPARR